MSGFSIKGAWPARLLAAQRLKERDEKGFARLHGTSGSGLQPSVVRMSRQQLSDLE